MKYMDLILNRFVRGCKSKQCTVSPHHDYDSARIGLRQEDIAGVLCNKYGI